jgi:hypothetical protein
VNLQKKKKVSRKGSPEFAKIKTAPILIQFIPCGLGTYAHVCD